MRGGGKARCKVDKCNAVYSSIRWRQLSLQRNLFPMTPHNGVY